MLNNPEDQSHNAGLENNTTKDEESAGQEAINDWLPLTSSRIEKWWYSTFHNINSMMGAGVLGLPYALSQLGWGPGVTFLILAWSITLYTLWQMVQMHEMVPGKRFDRYHELGQHVFGQKLGLYLVVPQQVVCDVGIDILFMVTGGKSIQKIHKLLSKDGSDLGITWCIMIYASSQFVLSHLPNFNSISGISLIAAVMALSYSAISWAASIYRGVQPDVSYGPRFHTPSDRVFNFLSALGNISFSYAGHNVVMEIQASIPSTKENPSKGPMWKGVVMAYVLVAACYLPVAFIGYWMFGNKVDDNILITLERPTWLIVVANMFVLIHVAGGYQLFAMPVYDMIETLMVKKLNFKPSLMLRFTSRNIYVGVTMFVAICVPFFGGLLGFFGGITFASTSYFLPCIIWLKLYKPKKFSLSWITNWICIIVGVFLMIFAPIGGLQQIIVSAKSYKFFR